MTVSPSAEVARGPAGLIDELRWRGLFHAATPGLAERLATSRPISAYVGFDPSGPSLHVGHLVPVFGLLNLQRHGGRPIALVGGATGMIGDPSGRSAERNLLDRDTIAANAAGIRSQLERFLDFSPGPTAAIMANNLDWLGEVSMLDFLRDVGKHFTVPYMLAKESVSERLGGGLSYTEFSYMLLQAADFRHLHRTMGVELQMGGSDQWGNITAGLELIRRSGRSAEAAAGAAAGAAAPESLTDSADDDGSAEEDRAFALSYPLLLDADGRKFGKTAAGTSVWLDPARTSPYAFYQFFIDAPDDQAAALLRLFTTLDQDEILDLEAEHERRPESRPVQRALAVDLTTRVHGVLEAERAVAVSRAAFDPAPVTDPDLLAEMYEVLDHADVSPADVAAGALRVAVASGLFTSNGEARRAISQGGFSVNGRRIATSEESVEPIADRWLLLRAGRKRLLVARVGGS